MTDPTITTQETTAIVCVNHPNRETRLRCNRCGDPICPDCAVLTPTGYRCKKCVRGQQKIFETAQWTDYPVSIIIAGLLGFAGSYIASFLGFFAIFIAPVTGVIIAEGVRWAIKRRRSKGVFLAATAAAVAGSLPMLLLRVFGGVLGAANGSFFSLLPLIFQGLFTFLIASTVYYRLSGIQLGRR